MSEIYDLVVDFPNQVHLAYNVDVPKIKKNFSNIIIVGMGGCYISGLLLKEILKQELDMPIEVYPGFLPRIDKKSLVILISYSGNTKEILNTFDLVKKHGNLLVLTSGGKLIKKAKNKNLIKIPSELHQRFTVAFTSLPILKALDKSNIIQNKEKTIKKIIEVLIKEQQNLEKQAEKLAEKMKNKIPLIYSTACLYSSAYRMQTSLEEDAKIICHANKITELFHNELEALPDSRFFPILIMEEKEIKKYKKQLRFFKRYIKEYYKFPYEGYSKEKRIFLIFYFADFLGFYLSKLRKTKMGETPLSDKIKKL